MEKPKKSISAIIMGVFTAIYLLMMILPVAANALNLLSPKTRHTKAANTLFTETIAQGEDLNTSLTISKESDRYEVSEQEDFVFRIFNHTDEPILFDKQGYGREIYWFDQNFNKWQKANLYRQPVSTPQRLIPSLQITSPQAGLGFMHLNDIEIGAFDIIRLYFSGIGETSGTQYTAFIDLKIIEP